MINLKKLLWLVVLVHSSSFAMFLSLRHIARKKYSLHRRFCEDNYHHVKPCPTYLEKIREEKLYDLLLNDIKDRNVALQKKLDSQNVVIKKCLEQDIVNRWRLKNDLYWAEKELQMVAKD